MAKILIVDDAADFRIMCREMPDLKIIAVSGVLPTDSESLIQLIRQFGVTEIFSKPVNFPDLFATINSLLEV